MPQTPVNELPRPGQLEFTFEELMASHPYEEPLRAGDVLCHGGFIGGQYVSPRTFVRTPAIRNWQQRLRDEKQPLLDLPRAYVPPQYPSYEQAKLLIQEGIKDPITKKVHESYMAYLGKYRAWAAYSEKVYHDKIGV